MNKEQIKDCSSQPDDIAKSKIPEQNEDDTVASSSTDSSYTLLFGATSYSKAPPCIGRPNFSPQTPDPRTSRISATNLKQRIDPHNPLGLMNLRT